MKAERAAHIISMANRWRIDGNPFPFMKTAEVAELSAYKANKPITELQALEEMANGKAS